MKYTNDNHRKNVSRNLNKIVAQINKKIIEKPQLAIVLGSGLGNFVNQIKNSVEISYSDIKGLPNSTVKGHSGKFIFGEIGGVKVLIMQGRFHLYEGYSAKQVTLPIYIFKKLGIKTLLLTNAAGAINRNYKTGDLMIVNDHINLTGTNPLVGGAIIESEERFIDMQSAYDKKYISLLNNISKKFNLDVKNGTYIQFLGPNYETNAEVEMARMFGADAVGMSTAIEVIAANQLGIRTLAISAISNSAGEVLTKGMPINNVITHQQVLEAMEKIEDKFTKLVLEFIRTIE